MNNVVFIAINKGGVVTDKEVAVGMDDSQFVTKFEAFKRKNFGFFTTFFMQSELVELLKKFEKK